MALASPIWAKFVFPPFPHLPSERKGISTNGITSEVEGATEPEGTEILADSEALDFTSDPAEALLVLLKIAHLQFVSIPAALSTDELSEVAILCDQYDCAQLVKPWLTGWLANEDTEWKKIEGTESGSKEKCLFIAWVFGREQVLRGVSSNLVRENWTSQATRMSLFKSNCPLPPGLASESFY